jgi:hypothetical protein
MYKLLDGLLSPISFAIPHYDQCQHATDSNTSL